MTAAVTRKEQEMSEKVTAENSKHNKQLRVD